MLVKRNLSILLLIFTHAYMFHIRSITLWVLSDPRLFLVPYWLTYFKQKLRQNGGNSCEFRHAVK